MATTTMDQMIVTDVMVPRALIAHPDRFGGVAQAECLRGDLVLRNGRVTGLRSADSTGRPRMVLPRLTEAHVHLDKCHTIDRLGPVGGDLKAAIDAQFEDRLGWTAEDIHARAARGLAELQSAGCGALRSHVDWGRGNDLTQPPLAWQVLRELAQDNRDDIALQLSPLVGIGELADPETAMAIARHTAEAGGSLGAFVHNQPELREGITQAFRAAQALGVPLDFHVDEGLDDALDGLSVIAETAIATGFDAPILCGHACSLMTQDGAALSRRLDRIARAGLIIAALPTTNLYLQGRTAGTPDRRGITRMRELQDAGVTVIVGTDNVRDAFCPIGRHDPVHALGLAALTAHLDPPMGDLLPMITTDAARALGEPPVHVDQAVLADLLISDAGSPSDLLSGRQPLRPLADAVRG